MTKLKVASGLELDADYIGGGTIALLAKKGAGKTYTGRVMAEEMWKAHVPFVVLDPMGAWWGLRAAANGKDEGIPVAIFGGDHGDVPLERKGGAVLADLVVDERLSMIVDMKRLGSRAAEREFARDFLERLYRRNSELVHVFMDEADLFAPQKPQAGDQPLLGVTENIVRRGRNAGIGITLITQRPAVLNKDVLTQVDGLVAMRITGYTDREAIDDWVKGHSDQDLAREVKPTLAGLANGECWWWVPEQDVLSRVQVRQSATFDSSPTRKRGTKTSKPRGFADIDMGVIAKKMEATIERAKADDPKHLKAEIRELRRQLAEAEKRPAKQETVSIVTDEDRRSLASLASTLAGHQAVAEDIAVQIDGVKTTLTRLASVQPAGPARPASRRPPARQVGTAERGGTARASVARAPEPVDGEFAPSRPQRRILSAIAALEVIGLAAPARTHVAFFAEVSPRSSGFEKNISTLSSGGMIHYPQPGCVALTDAGRAHADATDSLSTVDEMQDYVRRLVKPAKAKLIDVLLEVYPEGLHREELAERAGVSARSSGFEKNVSNLSSLGLVTYPDRGYVAAAPILFLEGS